MKSRYKGVFKTDLGYFAVYVYLNGNSRYIGTYPDEDQAAEIYNQTAQSLGLKTPLNNICKGHVDYLICKKCGRPITHTYRMTAKYCRDCQLTISFYSPKTILARRLRES